MNKTVALLSVLLLCSMATLAVPEQTEPLEPPAATEPLELPDAPEGFAWHELPEIKAAFLMPTGWHFKQEELAGALGFFFTKENIDELGRFDTGMTLNVFRRMKSPTAVEYARDFIAQMTAANETLRTWETETGPFQAFGCEVRVKIEDKEATTILHNLALANPNTNTLYLMWFESLEDDWEESWKTGKTMLELYLIDDEI